MPRAFSRAPFFGFGIDAEKDGDGEGFHGCSFNMKFPHGNKVSKHDGCTRRFEYSHKRARSG